MILLFKFLKKVIGKIIINKDDEILSLWKMADAAEACEDKIRADAIYKMIVKYDSTTELASIYISLAYHRMKKNNEALTLCEEVLAKFETRGLLDTYCYISLSSGEIIRCIRFFKKIHIFLPEFTDINFIVETIIKNDLLLSLFSTTKKIEPNDVLVFESFFDLLLRSLPEYPQKINTIISIIEFLRYKGFNDEYVVKLYGSIIVAPWFLKSVNLRDKYLLEVCFKNQLPWVSASVKESKMVATKYKDNINYLYKKSIKLGNLSPSSLSYSQSSWVPLFLNPTESQPCHSAISLFEKLCFKVWPRLDYVAPHVKSGTSLKSKNKIRIGFNVLDSMPMMSGLLINLDKSVFETYFLCPDMRSGGEQARLWVERADNVIEYSSSNTFAAIKTISDQQLDIIISGPSVPQVFFPMMARLAPLQMILLEPNWMDGTKNLDYYISWKEAEPKDPKNLYKSNVAFLKTPPYWIDRPPQLDVAYKKPELQKIRKRLLNVSSKRRVYLCANTPPKIHPEMDDVFFGILDEDRLATLVFLRSEYPAVDIIKDRLKARLGKYYSRVIFLPTLSRDDAHLLVQSVDCCLDSFPICGMSSSFDASILGVPLVTFPHKNSFGSWTAAIYKYIGVKGLIAKTKREYINIAIKLASDKNWRGEISKEIKAKSSVFVENKLAANEFQNFIIKAWGIKKNQSGLGL